MEVDGRSTRSREDLGRHAAQVRDCEKVVEGQPAQSGREVGRRIDSRYVPSVCPSPDLGVGRDDPLDLVPSVQERVGAVSEQAAFAWRRLLILFRMVCLTPLSESVHYPCALLAGRHHAAGRCSDARRELRAPGENLSGPRCRRCPNVVLTWFVTEPGSWPGGDWPPTDSPRPRQPGCRGVRSRMDRPWHTSTGRRRMHTAPPRESSPTS